MVCEGVETKLEYDLIKSYGCDFIQGYFISRPIDSDHTVEWLQVNNQNNEIDTLRN